jgi:RNA polymerase sigma factor (sigma-70 family)
MKTDRADDPTVVLYDGQRDGLMRWAFSLTGSLDTANDLVQEAFLALHKNRASITAPEAYVKQVIVNGARQEMRGRYRIPVDVPTDQDMTLVDVDLWRAVQSLKGLSRIAIVLRYLDDLPISDIAAQIGQTESNTKTILHRALRQLKRELS